MAWQFWIDRGGTFTDVVALSPTGQLSTVKLLSDNPEQYSDAAVAGIRTALGLAPDAPIPDGTICAVKMGTTVATNALLERKGARTLLITDRGFGDLLTIGTQARPRLFDLDIRKPEPLYAAVEEVGGRIDVAGCPLATLDEQSVLSMLRQRKAEGFHAVAISLLHAWQHPETETRLSRLAREAGFKQVSAGHEVSPLVGFVARGKTTVVDAYLSPVLRRYVDQVVGELGDVPLYFMQSNGGLTHAGGFQGKDAILSGPAGGVVGAVRTATAAGFDRVIAFDMGGTSTDVSLYAGSFERTFDAEVGGVQLRAPMMSINTVAAGGGSILHFDGGRFQVGPQSAGANPGPACYRRGGPLTVTDANVMVGKVRPEYFPAIFGPHGDLPIDVAVVTQRFAALAREVGAAGSCAPPDPRDVAEGFLEIAVANMAQAIKQVSLEKGHDARDFVLQSFGGAAGQHACRVADELGMETVFIHPYEGVLSAYGMGVADRSAMRQQSIERPLEVAKHEVESVARALAEKTVADVEGTGDVRVLRTVYLRYTGTDTALPVPLDARSLSSAFDEAHRARFGFSTPEREMTVESVSVEAVRASPPPRWPALVAATSPAMSLGTVVIWTDGRECTAKVYERVGLRPGHRIAGPALVRADIATTIVEPGWTAEVDGGGNLILRRTTPRREANRSADQPDPVRLELFNNLFMATAEHMGVVLRNTSTSVNIKERLDFSCALFDADGNLVANAPHVPVHLGAMGESVRIVLNARRGRLKPGDSVALNDPFHGGTHLPDVTVVTPVFDATGTTIRFFVANRSHHADIGGVTPGSMPPDSRTLEEEGVLLDDFLLVDAGQFRETAFREILTTAKWPARSPATNIADIKAQVAANATGIRELTHLIERYGWPQVAAYMRHVRDNAEESIRRVIDRIGDGDFDYEMDDGARLKVAVRVDRSRRSATIDFTGTGRQSAGNFNAPPAVTRAVVLYAFRCLVGADLPLNEGCLTPLNIVLPEGSFLAPTPGSAVVAGNTETSQATACALLGALGAVASAQGTMNNFLFGNARHQYYETICGGAGAGRDFDGASAVHTHMTNTRITDPEILEMRYPVRVEQFAVRRGSGGPGRHRGGDGVVRAIRALEPLTATIVSSRRTVAPFGLSGGGSGALGDQWVIRTEGTRQPLRGSDRVELNAGDVVVIATPGGGGYGTPTR
ncbi:MAG TPA: hydantoinase B/oxoprolinase family protein [Steroidobacteraceae bacterium]|jgi:5-oxoprolinase (ATP-hydrolysing)